MSERATIRCFGCGAALAPGQLVPTDGHCPSCGIGVLMLTSPAASAAQKWPGAVTGLREEIAQLRAEVERLHAEVAAQRVPVYLPIPRPCDHVLDDGRCLCCGHDVEYSP